MTPSDYNQIRKKEDFFSWIDDWFGKRLSPEHLRELLRRNRESKRMHEEAFVVFQYIRRCYINRDVFVELREGNQNFDAIIYDETNIFLEYVEVTGVPQEDDHTQRNELADNGQLSMESFLMHNPSFEKYPEKVLAIIQKKINKNYPVNTTLLVSLSAEMILEMKERFDYLVKYIQSKITNSTFKQIIIIDETGTFHHRIILNAP